MKGDFKMNEEKALSEKWNLSELLEKKKAAESENKAVKKILDNLKQEMLDSGIDRFNNHGVSVVVSHTEKTDMDEDKLIDILQQLSDSGDEVAKSCLVMVPAVDLDKLEQAIYHNRLDKTIITKATTSKIVNTIRLTKMKENK